MKMLRKRTFRCLFQFALFAAVTASSLAQTAPPVDPGSRGRGNSEMDRALESRARVLDHARSVSIATTGGAAASTGESLSRSNSTGTAAATGGRETAADASVSVMADRSRRTEATFGLDRLNLRSQHSDRSERGMSARNDVRSPGEKGMQEAANHSDRMEGVSTVAEARTGRGRMFARLTSGKSRMSSSESTKNDPVADPKNFAEEKQFRSVYEPDRKRPGADCDLPRRMAQIDRMRDRALESGNTDLLRQADRLEVLARAQYTQRTTGEHSVGIAMKTFNQDQREPVITPEPSPITAPVP